MKKLIVRLLSISLLLFGITPAFSAITVSSDDFDSLNLPDALNGGDYVSSVPGWTFVGNNGPRGTNNIGPLVPAFTQHPDLADTSPTGGVVGCMDGPNGNFFFNVPSGQGISRDVGTIDQDQIYTVTLCMFGDRENASTYAGYTLELRSGATQLSSLSSNTLPPPFSDVSFTWDSSQLPAGINQGDPLTVRILSNGSGNYLDYDNFRITAVPIISACTTSWEQDLVIQPNDAVPSFSGSGSQGPRGIAVDSAGNIYVSRHGNGPLYKFDASGTQLFSAGSGFSALNSIATDAAQNIYVTDVNLHQLRKYSPTGVLQWTRGGLGDHRDVGVGTDGTIYSSGGSGTRVVYRTAQDGTAMSNFLVAGDASPPLAGNFSIAVDASDNVYLSDSFTVNGPTVYRFDSSGTQTLAFSAATPAFIFAVGIAADAAGNIYVADAQSGHVHQFGPDGTQLSTIPVGAGSPGLVNPNGVDVDSAGAVYVSDIGTDSVYRFICAPIPDADNDTIPDNEDNCPDDANESQEDLDEDGVGDVCDDDADGDGEMPPLDCNDLDPGIYTTAIEICDDNVDNDCDFLIDAADDGGDCDGDGIPNGSDNCPDDANPGQSDLDNDGEGDVCDTDDDGDGVEDSLDNCPVVANDQADFDLDGVGDACDADADGDGVDDANDACLNTASSDSVAGVPSRRLGKNRWADTDGDGVFDTKGNNPTGRSFTINDALGCNCAQIIATCDYGNGHTKFGCSNSVMDWWTGLHDRDGELAGQCKDD